VVLGEYVILRDKLAQDFIGNWLHRHLASDTVEDTYQGSKGMQRFWNYLRVW
jgi:hypothetical protein